MFGDGSYGDRAKASGYAWAPDGVPPRVWWGLLDKDNIEQTMDEFPAFTRQISQPWQISNIAAKIINAAESLGVSPQKVEAFRERIAPLLKPKDYGKVVTMVNKAEHTSKVLADMVREKQIEILAANPKLSLLESFRAACELIRVTTPGAFGVYQLSTRTD